MTSGINLNPAATTDQTVKNRSLALQVADSLGYIPLLGVGIGAARIVVSVTTAVFVGIGYAATSAIKGIGHKISPNFEGTSLQKVKDSCSFIGKRAAGEINRGVYQELIGGFVPGASFYADRHSDEVDQFLQIKCARGSFVNQTATEYTFAKAPSLGVTPAKNPFSDGDITDSESDDDYGITEHVETPDLTPGWSEMYANLAEDTQNTQDYLV